MDIRKIGWALAFAAFWILARLSMAGDAAYIIEPPDILELEVFGAPAAVKSIQAKHTVWPDGKISLGDYGRVYVAGKSVEQVRTAIEEFLTPHVDAQREVGVHVGVAARNSKAYYVVTAGKDGNLVYRFPLTGNETAVGAVLQVEGLAAVAAKDGLSVARPKEGVLKVDWPAITQEGRLATNHQLHAGDRVYVGVAPPQ